MSLQLHCTSTVFLGFLFQFHNEPVLSQESTVPRSVLLLDWSKRQIYVLKVNIKENGRRKAALRAPIFHCAVSNWTVYITAWWIKNKPLLQNVIAKIVCELCSPLRSVNDSWSKRCIWGDFLGLVFNIYTFSVNLRSHNYYPLVSVDVG